MNNTLIVCEPNQATEKLSPVIEQVFGPCKTVSPKKFDGNFENHDSVVILYSLVQGQMQPLIKKFIEDYQKQLQQKKVAVLCLAESRAASEQSLHDMSVSLGDCVLTLDFIEICGNSSEPLQAAPDEIAAKLIQLKRKLIDSADMPGNILNQQIDQILHAHNTCTLCTGFGTRLRATPIEYLYDHGILYFISEGGEKFANLSVNPLVSIAVYNFYSGFNSLESIQIEGKAEMIKPFSDEYLNVMKMKGLNAENLRSLPALLNVFQVLPSRFEVLKSDFKKDGYSARQVISSIN